MDELKSHYKRGGLGDVKVKLFLNNIINDLLTPIRNKRKELEQNIDSVYEILFNGSEKASKFAKENLKNVKKAMGINYKIL